MKTLLALLCVLTLRSLASAQCSGGSCYAPSTMQFAPQYVPVQPTVSLYTGWYKDGEDMTYWHNGYKVGGFNITSMEWSDGKNKFALLPKPERLPVADLPKASENYGMDWKPGESEKSTINGKECVKDRLIQSIQRGGGANDIPQDGNTPRITIIGDATATAKVVQSIDPAYKGKYIVAERTPDSWDVKDLYPAKMGNPTVYITDGDGKKRSVSGGEGINVALAAVDKIRTPQPDSPTPDLTKPDAVKPKTPNTPANDTPSVPTWVYVAGIGGLIVLAGKKGSS